MLSFVFNGLGQIYNGQIIKGLFIMALSTVSMLVLLVSAVFIGYCLLNNLILIKWFIASLISLGLSIIAIAILGVYNIFDAYNNAK